MSAPGPSRDRGIRDGRVPATIGSGPPATAGIDAGWFGRRRLLWVLVVAGAAPLARTIAVHQGFGWRASVVAAGVLAVALVVVRLPPADSVGIGLRRGAAAIAAAAALGALGGGRIVGAWLAVTVALGLWCALGDRLQPRPSFDRRSLAPVLALSYVAAALARDPQRMAEALAASAAALGCALVLARHGQWVQSVGAAARERLRTLGASLPVPVWVLLGPGMLWWCSNVWFWALGLVRTDSIGYHAWRHGLGHSSYQSVMPWFGAVSWILLVLVLGALLAVEGRRVIRPVVVTTLALTVAAAVSIWSVVWIWPHELL